MGDLSIQLLLITGMLIFVLTIGVPISFALGFVSVIGILIFLSPEQLLHLATIAYSQSTSINLMVIPLFLLMAEFLAISGIAKDLIRLAHHYFKKIPGGLLISTVIGCAGFSSVCGSSTATVTTLGVVSIPELIRQKYNKKFVAGAVVSGGTLGVLIPPSIAFILYGIITEMPIATLFIAGIIPGILTTVLLCLYIFIRAKMTPSLAPLTVESEIQDLDVNRWLLLLKMSPVILLALTIFFFIYTGVATPTEIGAVGAVGAILLTFFYRRFSWYKLKLILLGTVKTTSMLFFLAIGGMAFAYLLSFIGLPQYLIGLILDLGVNRWVIIVAINILVLILGCFLDPVGMIVIALPFIFPVIRGLGFDPIWFGVVMTLNMQIGMVTPPVGINLFALRGALPHELKLEEIIQGSIPYVLVLLLALIIIILFPRIALFLPSIK